jgi:hypothetical protein
MQSLSVILLLVGNVFAQSFWTPERKTETVIYAGAIAADSWASSLTNNPELDPLARPFVNHGIKAQAVGAAIGFAAGIGPSYLFHKTGHERASRWWLRVFTAGETVNAARMVYLYH